MSTMLARWSVRAEGDWPAGPEADEHGERLIDTISEAIEAGMAAAQNRLDEALGEGVVTLEMDR